MDWMRSILREVAEDYRQLGLQLTYPQGKVPLRIFRPLVALLVAGLLGLWLWH